MITSILIDNTEYISKLTEKGSFERDYKVEDKVNNPLSSSFNMTLNNRPEIQDTIYNAFVSELKGLTKIFAGAVKIFEGYIYGDNTSPDKITGEIEIEVIGKEQFFSKELSRHDITQLYYTPDATPRRQRGGRETTPRIDHTLYQNFSDLIETMFSDLSFSLSNIIIGFTEYLNSTYLNYLYETEKFGNIDVLKPVTKIRNTGGRGLQELNTIRNKVYYELDDDSDSYNYLIKQLAQLGGFVYFYDHVTDKFLFMTRDYDFTEDLSQEVLSIDDLIIETSYTEKVKAPYDGLVIVFNDIKLAVKLTRDSSGTITNTEYGFESDYFSSGSNETIKFIGDSRYPDGEFYQRYFAFCSIEQSITDSLYFNNAIVVDVDSSIYAFIKPLPAGLFITIKDFLDLIIQNYSYSLSSYREIECELNGLFYAPFRISFDSTEINVLEAVNDFNSKTTKIKFEY